MTNPVTHHRTATLDAAHREGGANVCLFADGSVIVGMTAANGSANMQMHMDASDLRALAKLLNEAVEKLPTPISLVGSAA